MTKTGTKTAERLNNGRILYSVEDAAEVLSIGRSTLYTLIQTNQIVSVKVGHRRLIPRSSLERYEAQLIRISNDETFRCMGVIR